ncbi:MAG: hypothetical protein Q9165_004485 [Trypethelium subeluteriae]
MELAETLKGPEQVAIESATTRTRTSSTTISLSSNSATTKASLPLLPPSSQTRAHNASTLTHPTITESAPDLPTRRSTRPLANPDLFKPTPTHHPTAPQSGPVDEVDAALYRQPTPTNRQPSPSATGGGGSNNNNNKPGSKWQPLTSVAPQPEPEDSDPFSVGDDEEEVAEKGRDLRPEDSERLKKAATEAGAGSAGQEGEGGAKGELRPAERSGSTVLKDAEAEKLLSPTTK